MKQWRPVMKHVSNETVEVSNETVEASNETGQ